MATPTSTTPGASTLGTQPMPLREARGPPLNLTLLELAAKSPRLEQKNDYENQAISDERNLRNLRLWGHFEREGPQQRSEDEEDVNRTLRQYLEASLSRGVLQLIILAGHAEAQPATPLQVIPTHFPVATRISGDDAYENLRPRVAVQFLSLAGDLQASRDDATGNRHSLSTAQ